MSCHIATNENRFYAGSEVSYGQTPTIDAKNRIPALKLAIKHTTEQPQRRDKVGGRSFAGLPTGLRRNTEYQLRTYLTSWSDSHDAPSYGPLFRAAMGSAPRLHARGVLAAGSSTTQLVFAGSHGLSAGQAVSFDGELRFVASVLDASSVELNAPLRAAPDAGSSTGAAITYSLGKKLPGVSIFDYWSPEEAVQRLICGALVDKMKVLVNADYHEFHFSGPAQELVDSLTFEAGQGQLTSFPAEPEAEAFDYSIVPGHMGQVWLGVTPERFYTLTAAEVSLDNGIDVRNREFGSRLIRCVSAGVRKVSFDFELYATDDDATKALYAAAKQRSPISAMLQLGEQSGQLFGAYAKSVVAETPQFDDGETRLRWKFSGARAQGAADDELVVAFG